jgi:hypothetical protein
MNGIIRKIIIGVTPKDAMAYDLGMRVGGGVVHTIVKDEETQSNRYLIYIKEDGALVLWKVVEDLPVVVEFDFNF